MNYNRILLNIKYPKLIVLAAMIIISFTLFQLPGPGDWVRSLGILTYPISLLAGFLLAFGVIAPFIAGFLVNARQENILLVAVLIAFGACIADLFIFSVIRKAFLKKVQHVDKKNIVIRARAEAIKRFGEFPINLASYYLAGILIAIPIPDKFGLAILDGLGKISNRKLVMVSFAMNFIVAMFFLLV